MAIISKITTPLRKLIDHPSVLVMCALLDGLFFVLYGLLTSPFFKSMENLLVNISDSVSYELDLIQQGQGNFGGMLDILLSAVVRTDLIKFILTGFAVVVVIYLLYNLIHGFCWKQAAQVNNLHKKKYLSHFFKVNIFWFTLLVLHSVVDVLQEVRFTINQRILGSTVNPVRYFMISVLIIGFYFAVISYKELNLRKTFKKSLNKEYVYGYLYLLALFFVINLVMSFASQISANLNFILGLVLFLPALSYSRIYFLGINDGK